MTDEKEKNQEEANTEEIQEEASNLYNKSEKLVERQEKANEKREELLNRQEAMRVKAKLNGNLDSGKGNPEPKKEMTDKEYAEAYEKGEVDPFKEK